MKRPHLFGKRPAAWLLLLLGSPLAACGAESDVAPALERLTQEQDGRIERVALRATQRGAQHEALAAPGMGRAGAHIERTPPQPIVERPGVGAPSPDARWIEGYWDWNASRRDFDWVTGAWRVPPPGKFWVSGYWRRDPTGWSRVPGFWSDGGAVPAQTGDPAPAPARTPDGSRTGPAPPRERPEERPGPAPGPDYFYIAGEYVPQGSQIVWKPGYWYPSQPGWEWMPAHWVRQASGWSFREGSWNPLRRPASAPTANGWPPVVATLPAGGAANADSSLALTAAEEEKPIGSPATEPSRMRSVVLPGYPIPTPTRTNSPTSWAGTPWNGGNSLGGLIGRFLPY